MSSPRVTFDLTCGKDGVRVTELQSLTNLGVSSFAESHQMQQPVTRDIEREWYISKYKVFTPSVVMGGGETCWQCVPYHHHQVDFH